jgi:hypothetical protein
MISMNAVHLVDSVLPVPDLLNQDSSINEEYVDVVPRSKVGFYYFLLILGSRKIKDKIAL